MTDEGYDIPIDGRDWTPITLRMIERFYHKGGASVAASIAINEDLVFLPLDKITIVDTGEITSERKIVDITMPMWLATDKRLA